MLRTSYSADAKYCVMTLDIIMTALMIKMKWPSISPSLFIFLVFCLDTQNWKLKYVIIETLGIWHEAKKK